MLPWLPFLFIYFYFLPFLISNSSESSIKSLTLLFFSRTYCLFQDPHYSQECHSQFPSISQESDWATLTSVKTLRLLPMFLSLVGKHQAKLFFFIVLHHKAVWVLSPPEMQGSCQLPKRRVVCTIRKPRVGIWNHSSSRAEGGGGIGKSVGYGLNLSTLSLNNLWL